MFEYINNILTNFSPQQRIIALLLLLTSIVLMTNGGELINSFKGTPKDITSTIENQQKQISTLQNETLRLNNQIIDNQKECTNKIIDNQKECTNKIIEREKSFSVEIQRIINLSKRQHINEMYILDTVQSVVSPRPIIINDDIIIKELEKLKISLQKK